MKSLILTKKHKDLILEMCKTLFPEYSWTWRYEEDGWFCGIINAWESQNRCEEFHWFELCLNHLADRIYPKHPFNWWGQIGRMVDRGWHPVDWLYREFKIYRNERKESKENKEGSVSII